MQYFDFEELSRWADAGEQRPQWLGVWVPDAERVFADLRDKGLAIEPPVSRDFGVVMLTVPDPFGHLWGFMRRLP